MKKTVLLILALKLVFSITVYADDALWEKKFSEDYAQSVTLPAVCGDYMFTAVNNTVLKIDSETGDVIESADILSGETGYALNPPSVWEKKLFIGIGEGRVQAIGTDGLKSLWVGGVDEGQTLTPVTVSGGLVFTGTWRGEMRDGKYFCLSAENGSLLWSLTHKGGFYGAGAYVGCGYLLFGSDDGSAGVTDGAVLYSVNPATGEIIDKTEGIYGDIRSSVCVDNGYAYFTTKGKRLYKIRVEEDGNLGDAEFCELGGMSTSTPIIHEKTAYVGVSGKSTFDKDGHSMKLINTETLEITASCELPGYPQREGVLTEHDGIVTVYTTCNTPPGGVYAVCYNGTDVSSFTVFEPKDQMAEHSISGIVLHNGRLYYKNDSGYIFAIGIKDYKPAPEESKPEPVPETQVDTPEIGTNSTIGVYLTMEKLVLGEGFIIEPVFLELPKGATVSDAVVMAMVENLGRDSYINTGSVDSGFYLSYVKDEQGEENIPQYITSAGENLGERADPMYLGEFDYTDTSGWMFCVNNEFPDVGASEYTLENKDVVRWQFTLLGKGADIGSDNSEWGRSSIVTVADKDKLIKRIAEINSVEAFDRLMKIEENRVGYENAMAVLSDIQATKAKIDEAYEGVKSLKKTDDKAESKDEIQEEKTPEMKPEKLPAFTDIKNHWAENYIIELWRNGLISGRSDTVFDPDAYVSRGELMVILHRLSMNDKKHVVTFGDVSESDYWYNSIGWAQSLGIAGGMENNMFCPEKAVSREMSAAFMQRFCQKTKYKLQDTSKRVLFSDQKKISGWAQSAVTEMVSAGVLSGHANGTFAPLDNTTRAECACMIHKILRGSN